MRISNQAVGAIMMALQNSLMNQTDIVPVLKEFNFELDENEELLVLNPPVVDSSNMESQDNDFEDEKINTVGSD